MAEQTMNEAGRGIDLITIPRAMLSFTAGMVHTLECAILGEARVRTARGNAWEAICADRARARRRDEVRQVVAALATPPAGGDPATGPGLRPTVGRRSFR